MTISHLPDHTDAEQDAPVAASAPGPEPASPPARKDPVRRVVVFVGKHRPHPA